MGANHSQQQQAKEVKLSEREEQENAIKLLEERLEKHDENRKAVQDKLTEIRNKLTEQVDKLEDRINKELEEKFIAEDSRLQGALSELRGNISAVALQKAKAELFIQSYEIIENKGPNLDLTTLYKLETEKRDVPEDDCSVGHTHIPSDTTEKSETTCGSDEFSEERECLTRLLEGRLEAHDNNRKAIQEKLHDICERLKTQIDELEDRINRELEEKFTSEDSRLQAALNELRENIPLVSTLQKAKAELLIQQSYDVIENNLDPSHDPTTLYKLETERRIDPEVMEVRKPTNVRVTGVDGGRVFVEFTCINPDEERVLSDNAIANPVGYRCLLFERGRNRSGREYSLCKNEENDGGKSSPFFTFTPDILEVGTPYKIRVKMVVGGKESEWSDEIAEFVAPEFKECCVWKKCPRYVDEKRKYNMDEKNPRVATKVNKDSWCTIIGNTHIPLDTVTSWSIKVHKSWDNAGGCIFIGVAPSDINQNDNYNYDNNGWYFSCCCSWLYSGPPHSYSGKEYGPRKEKGQYMHTDESVGVVMDTTKDELSFVLNGVNLGVAYEGIPLDKPLVPCVILGYSGDSVGLII